MWHIFNPKKYYLVSKTHLWLDLLAFITTLALIFVVAKYSSWRPWLPTTPAIIRTPAGQQATSSNIAPEPKLAIDVATNAIAWQNKKPNQFLIRLENLDGATYRNLKLKVAISNKNLKIKTISTRQPGRLENRTLVVDNLAPNEIMVIPLSITVDNPAAKTEQRAAVELEATYEAGGETVSISTETDSLPYGSSADVRAIAKYYGPQGDQLGIGPLPPLVGIPTDYWVFWQADNLGNDLENFIMTAKLPANASYIDKKTLLAGNLDYDAGLHSVLWRIKKIDKSGGDYRAGFMVRIIPAAKDIGKTLPLSGPAAYSAVDSFTHQKIDGMTPPIDTDLQADPLARGKGRVEN